MPANAQFQYTQDLIPPQRFENIAWEETRGPCRVFKLTGMPCPVGTNEKTLQLRDRMSARDHEDFRLDLDRWDMDSWQRRRAMVVRSMAASLAKKEESASPVAEVRRPIMEQLRQHARAALSKL
jgi:hypothetical protein